MKRYNKVLGGLVAGILFVGIIGHCFRPACEKTYTTTKWKLYTGTDTLIFDSEEELIDYIYDDTLQ